jgi:thioredoxin reductase/Pyruvate/2-oxoacid:ferredoxin oxidoreductase delta subunit
MDPSITWPLVGAAVTLALFAFQLWRRGVRSRRDEAKLAKNVEAGRNQPQSLHPVIDTDLCIGSLSCLKACPEGDILGLVGNAAKLVHADHCIGHGRCAAECPVGAIRLVFGTAERGVDLPEVDEFFESSRAGVHVIGEMGGMGLVKNAVTQGLQVADRLVELLAKGTPPADGVDVAIVGAGPAGLAAAAALKQKGVSFRLLEQGSFGGTVASYPRQKIVMTEPVVMPFLGKFGKAMISKEELLAGWNRLRGKGQISVDEGVKVVGLEGEDGSYRVKTDKGWVNARKVVLACGRRGTPRKLGCPGEQQEKVTYSLVDATQYDGCNMLVVGGGDSALEAAASLAEQSTAKVAISYRGENFSKCREKNRVKITALGEEGRVQVLLGSSVQKIGKEDVELKLQSGEALTLPNDYVIVQAGGELPLEFLKAMGVSVRRYHSEAMGETAKGHDHPDQSHAGRRARAGSAKLQADAQFRRIAGLLYVGVGAIILTSLVAHGADYYILSRLERLHSSDHRALRPAGTFGHPVGIVATAFMLSNFLYAVRKRARSMTGLGSIRGWLDFHMFVGFMSPLVISFHAAFQSNNQLASATALSLLVVVSTGIIGRYIFGLVPSERGQSLDMADLRARVSRVQDRVMPLLSDAAQREPLERLLAQTKVDPKNETEDGTIVGLLLLLVTRPFALLWLRLRIVRCRLLFRARADYFEFRNALIGLHQLRTQIHFYGALKKMMRTWRLFHASLAVILVMIMTAHIGVSLFLGYGWRR